MKILIVDDSRAMRMIVRRTLRQAGFEGHEVIEAENGRDALNHIDGADLILSDWNMPQMTGIELLTHLRSKGNEVDFVFVTSEGTPEMRKRASDAGAYGLVAKPFTAETFQVVLSPLLG